MCAIRGGKGSHVAGQPADAADNEETGFRCHLETNPADQTLRLVFADWLEERGRTPEAEEQRDIVARQHQEAAEEAAEQAWLEAALNRQFLDECEEWNRRINSSRPMDEDLSLAPLLLASMGVMLGFIVFCVFCVAFVVYFSRI